MTPRVDFYVLPVDEPHARLSFACRLTEKAWLAGHRVYLHGADASTAAALDSLLWSFRDTAFVPHDPAPGTAPVQVGCGSDAPGHDDVLINLDESVPPFFARFARVAEIVLSESQARAAGRVRWNTYKEHGCALEHHDMQSLRGTGER